MAASGVSLQLVKEVRALAPEFRKRLSESVPRFPTEDFKILGEIGALSAPLPESEGGLGFGTDAGMFRNLLLLLKELGRSNLVLGRIFEGHVNALLLIQRYGTAQQIKQAALEVRENHCLFGVWNSGRAGEPSVSRATGGGFRFAGGKSFASGAGEIQRAIVTGALNESQWQMFIMPLDQVSYGVDLDSWHPIGMQASGSFSVDFTGIELDLDTALGNPNQYYAEPFFTGGAFRFSSVHLGGAEALFEFCKDYLCEMRYQTDPHQLHRVGRMFLAIESGRQWLEQAAHWLEKGGDCAHCLAIKAHMMRVAVEQICTEVMGLVEVCVGARGLQGPRPIGTMLRDLRMYLRQAGADSALTAIGRSAFEQAGNG